MIFGKKKPDDINATDAFKLLNTWQSQFIPFSGNAWDVSTVRAAIHSFARRAAKIQPRHIRRADGKISDAPSGLNNLLQFRPNPLSTAYKFYYRIAAQYKLYNNAFIYPVWGKTGKLEALYNINANTINLVEYNGELFCNFRFMNGNQYTFPYTDFIHIGSMFADNDIFGDSNKAILPVLDTADKLEQSMAKSAELVAVVRGILKYSAVAKNEDLNKRRDEFIKDNLRMEHNGAGVIVTDNKYEYTPINDKQTPIPQGQLTHVKSEIYDYFGTNEDIVQNKATLEQEDCFYEGEIKPFMIQLQQAFTNCIFSDRERGCGNEIVAEGDKLQFAKMSDKLSAVKHLSDMGAITLDQALVTLGFPAIGGEEGSRRVQTLNMINATRADEYQLGDEEQDKKADPKEEGDNNV